MRLCTDVPRTNSMFSNVSLAVLTGQSEMQGLKQFIAVFTARYLAADIERVASESVFSTRHGLAPSLDQSLGFWRKLDNWKCMVIQQSTSNKSCKVYICVYAGYIFICSLRTLRRTRYVSREMEFIRIKLSFKRTSLCTAGTAQQRIGNLRFPLREQSNVEFCPRRATQRRRKSAVTDVSRMHGQRTNHLRVVARRHED